MSHPLQEAEAPEVAETVLVCATKPNADEPLVVLASGSYVTASERVFFDNDPDEEVLRLPLGVPVAVRPVRRFHAVAPEPEGELALLRAIRRVRSLPSGKPEAGHAGNLLAQTFSSAVRAGDATTGTHLASLLATRRGTAAVYRAMSDCLAELGEDWAQGRSPVLAERAATQAAQSVCDRLRAHLPAPTACGTVVLATPPGERHTLALAAVAHLLQEAGRSVLVVDDLPIDELAQLASEPGTAAVVLSAHVTLPLAAARRLIGALREAAPGIFLVAGGPGFPRSASAGADLVTDDVELLLRELEERSSALTHREREVLLAVAEGLTNAEIAEQLCVSPSTVKTHLDHVLHKTGAEHRAAAVARALRQGWIR
jgi:DNA-binding CsgD family transcriptional regulator/methanogenic corrinoid protein MtbC1